MVFLSSFGAKVGPKKGAASLRDGGQGWERNLHKRRWMLKSKKMLVQAGRDI